MFQKMARVYITDSESNMKEECLLEWTHSRKDGSCYLLHSRAGQEMVDFVSIYHQSSNMAVQLSTLACRHVQALG